jgi:hypothetical protein
VDSCSVTAKLLQRFAFLAGVLLCFVSWSCFRGYDLSKVKCLTGTDCPTGYSCLWHPEQAQGTCTAGDIDGGRADQQAMRGLDGSGASEGPVGDGPLDIPTGGTGGGRSDTRLDDAGGAVGGMGGTAGNVDAAVRGSTGSFVGGESVGGQTRGGVASTQSTTETGGVVGNPDAPVQNPDSPVLSPDTALAKGAPCTSNGQCATTQCIDGFCCEKPCNGCNACSNAMTGQADGTCAPVLVGRDPHETCTDETTTKPCGDDGTCDGKGRCRKVGAGQECGPASCSTDGTTFTPKPKCDGNGACLAGTAQVCSPYDCAITGCKKTCTTQDQCDTGTYCDTTAGTCVTKKTNGKPATQTYECESRVIADGVCCSAPCGICHSCANATGTCNLVDNGTTCTTGVCNNGNCNPCTANQPCSVSGEECWNHTTSCSSGTNQCAKATPVVNGTLCGSGPTCSDPTKSYGHWTCQDGRCVQPSTYATCPSTGCNTSTGLCNPACSTSTQTECGSTCCSRSAEYCVGNTSCGTKVPLGSACPDGNGQCQLGSYCVSGICCEATQCGHDQVCSTGHCACTGLTFTCGGCGTWTFSSGTEYWVSDSPDIAMLGATNGRLEVSVKTSGYNQFGFSVPICQSGSSFLYGYTLSADVTATGSQTMPYNVIFGTTAGTESSSTDSMPLSLENPVHFQATLTPGAAVERIGFMLIISDAWSGTIYLDNVRVVKP